MSQFVLSSGKVATADGQDAQLRVQLVQSDDALDRLSGAWNRLASGVPFRRWDWLAAWWRHYRRPERELFVLAVKDVRGRLVGLAPWFVERSVVFGRVIKCLGSGKVSSDYTTVLSAAGREKAVAERLAAWLMQETATGWDALELEGVDSEDVAIGYLAGALRNHGCDAQRRWLVSCWRIDLPTSWDAYVSTLSKSRRERVRQLCRRQLDTGRTQVHWVQDESQLDRAWSHLQELHQRRRRSLGQRGCFACDRFSSFAREAAGRFLASGDLRLQWLEQDHLPIAAQCDFVGGDTAYYYQSGCDPGRLSERPGWLSMIAAIRRAQLDGCRTYDLLRGDYAFKSHWRGRRRPLIDLRIVPAEAAARVRHGIWQGKELGKSYLKRGLRRAGRLRGCQPLGPGTAGKTSVVKPTLQDQER